MKVGRPERRTATESVTMATRQLKRRPHAVVRLAEGCGMRVREVRESVVARRRVCSLGGWLGSSGL